MSSPINIPSQQPYRQGLAGDQSPFPETEGPYMGYTELYENGHIYRAVSSGSGKFVTLSPRCELPFLSFVVEKDRAKDSMTIAFRSRHLKQIISHVLGQDVVPPLQLTLDFGQVLQHYVGLRFELDELDCHSPYGDLTKEMRLLVDDILLEPSLYDGIGIDALRQQGIISTALLQDIHQRNMDIGINDLEECFRLGQTPPQEANKFLGIQNAEIYRLAQTGRLDLVRGHCEPLLRSNGIRILFDPDLLTQILDKGYWDVYEYILDLVERTRPILKELPNADYVDITYDPLCVAIRLGHYYTVKLLVECHYMTFMGYIEDIPGGSDRVFTPLLAAVLWQQVDIIPLLLCSPMYHVELLQANQLAAEMGLPHVLQALADLPVESTSAYQGMSAKYPVPKAPQFHPTSLSSPNCTPISLSPSGNGSISGISSALSNSWTCSAVNGDYDPVTSIPSIASPGMLSQATPSPILPEIYVSPKDLTLSDPVSSPRFDPPILHNVPVGVPQQVSPVSILQQPTTQSLFIDYTKSHRLRQTLGHASVIRLQQRCWRIGTVCDGHGNSSEHEIIRDQCASPKTASKLGLNYMRNIMRNELRPELIGILQALLVADALICQAPDAEKLEEEFIKDLCRWRFLLLGKNADTDMFDEFVCAAWKTESLPAPATLETCGDLLRFGELVEGFVSRTDIKPPDPKPHGSRLRTVQRQLKGVYNQDPQPFANMASRSSSLLLEARAIIPRIEVMDPKVVMILESVAFNVLFATSSFQDMEDSCFLEPLFGTPASINRTSATLESSLNFELPDQLSCDSGIGMELSVKDSMSPRMPGTKDVSHRSQASSPSTKPSGFADGVYDSTTQYTENFNLADFDSLLPGLDGIKMFETDGQAADALFGYPYITVTEDVLNMDASLSQDPFSAQPLDIQFVSMSPRLSEGDDTYPSLSKIDLPRRMPGPQSPSRPNGFGLTCDHCGKLFSNRGNRNKHMNSACRNKSNPRFPCRYSHLGCTSMATTVWNRDSHEEKWCSHNPNLERNMKSTGLTS
ncbi:Ff.00g110340.m01.CDS01 [Fusarium sp. VM40]|nr:Ff.00g110340.m01.CDS01 [Fusarium sp. VM40]